MTLCMACGLAKGVAMFIIIGFMPMPIPILMFMLIWGMVICWAA